MKSTIFVLSNPRFHARLTDLGVDERWATYRVPILPAYAILSYSIQGINAELGGKVLPADTGIVDDTVVVNRLDDLALALTSSQPTLVINYIGIRDYQKFFPHFKGASLKGRAAQFLEEADKTFDDGSWLSFVMMAGAVFESFLVDLTGKGSETLGSLVKKVNSKGLFSDLEVEALAAATEARNLVHAGRHKQPYISRDRAMAVRVALEQFLRKDWGQLKKNYRKRSTGVRNPRAKKK